MTATAGGGLVWSFEASRVLGVAMEEERATIEAHGGPALELLLPVLVPPIRRREKTVFSGWCRVGEDHPL